MTEYEAMQDKKRKHRWFVVVAGSRMVLSAQCTRNAFHERRAEEMAAIYRKINPDKPVVVEWERISP